MKRNIKAGIWLCLVLLSYERVSSRNESGHEAKDISELPTEVEREADLGKRTVQVQPSFSSNEEIEVVEEDKPNHTDSIPAELVSDSLVEVITENGPKPLRDKSGIKTPLQDNKVSLLSTGIVKSSKNPAHTLWSVPYKTNVKTKQISAEEHKSRGNRYHSNSVVVSRVSIPGKHRTFSNANAKFKELALLSSPQFTALKHKYLENMTKLTSYYNTNTDGVGKEINQRDRNDYNHPVSTAHKGLNTTPSKLDHVNADEGTVGRRTHHLLLKNATSPNVIKGIPKSVTSSSKSNNISTKDEKMTDELFKKKEETVQSEPEVFDSFMSNSQHKSPPHELRMISSKHGPSTSPISKGVNEADEFQKKEEGTTQMEPEVFDSKLKVKNEKDALTSNSPNKNKEISISSIVNKGEHLRRQPMRSTNSEISNKSSSASRKDITPSNQTREGNTSKKLLNGDNHMKNTYGFVSPSHLYKDTTTLLENSVIKGQVEIPRKNSNNSSILDQEKVNERKYKFRNRSDSIFAAKGTLHGGSRSKSGSHILAHVHSIINSNGSSNMQLSSKTKGGFYLRLNSSVAKHLSDLISFFDSFKQSNNTNSFLPALSRYENETKINSGIKNNREKGSLETLLSLIRLNTPDNNTKEKAFAMANRQTPLNSSNESLLENNRRRVRVSIYRGWTEASKRKGLSQKVGSSKSASMRNTTSNLNYKKDFSTRRNFTRNEDEFEIRILEAMRNVSRKKLEKLKDYILKVLGSRHDHRNFLQFGQRNYQQNNQTRLGKQHKPDQERSNNSANYTGNEKRKQQQRPNHGHVEHPNGELKTSLHHEPDAEQQGIRKQSHSQGRKNLTRHEQIKNRTTMCHHKQQLVTKSLKEQSLISSYSLNWTKDQNCTSNSLHMPKQINNESHQTGFSSPPALIDRVSIFFHNHLSALRENASAFKARENQNKNDRNVKSPYIQSTFHISSPLAVQSSSPKKKARNSTSLSWVDNSQTISKTSLPSHAAEHVDDVKNISVQHDEDVFQEKDVNTSGVTQKLSSNVTEVTEYVEQVTDNANRFTKWSDWSSCSPSCGEGAKRKRTEYQCALNSQEMGDCTVSGEQLESCLHKPCPVDGRFTSWGNWSPCSTSCGFQGVSVRTTTCIPPRHGGRPCSAVRSRMRPCNRKHCPVNGGLSQWSRFGPCTKSCGGGVRMRHRQCNNPRPRYGGKDCDESDIVEIQSCGIRKCPVQIMRRPQVSNVNPKSLCDFNPYEEAGCLYDPTARCITDFECNPIFFNSDGKVISKCKGMESLYSHIPNVICSYNPCLSEQCWDIRGQCVVDLECRPIFIGIDKRTIPPDCQVHGTVRVDRINVDRSWNAPAPGVNLASDAMPPFTQFWYPVLPLPQVIQPDVSLGRFNSPVAPSRIFNTYPANRMNGLDRKGITEEVIEKPKSDTVYDGDDDDDDNADKEIDDEEDYDADVGYVNDDTDDDEFK